MKFLLILLLALAGPAQAQILSGGGGGGGGGLAATSFFIAATTGGANAYTIASLSGWALTNQNTIRATISTTNTAASTLNANASGALAIEKNVASGFVALAGGELVGGLEYDFTYNAGCNCYIVVNVAGGVILAGTTQTVTQAQWSTGAVFHVTTAAQTLTLPVTSSLALNGGIFIKTMGASVTLAPNAADQVVCGSTTSAAGVSITLPNEQTTLVTSNGAGLVYVAPCNVGYLDQAATWTAAQTYTNSDLKLLGSSTGATTFSSNNAGASNFTLTVPAVTDTLAAIGTAQSWTAAQTYTNSDLKLLGSSTGATTFSSANAGASNFTLTFPAATDTLAAIGTAQSWTASQRETPVNITISVATFTPNFDTGQNFEIDLVHASCPCTLANPSTTLKAGQSGVIEVHQSATGSDTISTWGADYQYVGGTSTITFSTAASAVDYLPYYVNNAATGIVLGTLLKGPAH